ncbi:ATP-NAD kinase-like domain-containing protein [Fennellomyces sp. T-0311]|nr:ATP-NAD kinase-like domain-containing protein [Fennellomyces sp. T-0311]
MQQPDIHETLDVNRAATAANHTRNQPRRATTYIPDLDIPDVMGYLSHSRVKWQARNDTILIITKAGDSRLLGYTRALTEWLVTTPRFGKQYPFTVNTLSYVDGHLEQSKSFQYAQLVEKNPIYKEKLRFWTPSLCHKNPSKFHLIITLGGDGTVLFTSWLFQTVVPPVLSVHLGSLNFLAPFSYSEHREALNDLFDGEGFRNTVRMRLSCTVYRHVEECESPKTADKTTGLLETAWMKKQLQQESHRISEAEREYLNAKIPCYTTVPCETYEVLNELVVDRGPSSYMSMLELFGDERHLTTVQADGLVIATPTGSTAYSLSAHGSLTHPDIRAILVTPICPHTLSFRPMLLPETMTIRVVVPFGSSRSAYCSFDGRNRVELKPGDHVRISMSKYPMPTVCRTESGNDWFSSLQCSLQWNVRQRQKSFVVLESEKEDQHDDTQESENLFACLQNGNKQPKNEEEEGSGSAEEHVDNGVLEWSAEELNK